MRRRPLTLSLSIDLLDRIDEEVEKRGLTSRTVFIEQMLRKSVGLPTIFTDNTSGG